MPRLIELVVAYLITYMALHWTSYVFVYPDFVGKVLGFNILKWGSRPSSSASTMVRGESKVTTDDMDINASPPKRMHHV